MSEKIGLNAYIKNVEKAVRRFPIFSPFGTSQITWIVLKLLKYLFGSQEHFYRELNVKLGILPEWQFILNYLYRARIITSPFLLEDERTEIDTEMFFLHIMGVYNSNHTDGYRTNFSYSHASSFAFEKACSRVVGEFLERYSLSLFRQADFTRGSANQLKNAKISFLDPSLLSGTIDQDDDAILNWVEGKRLFNRYSALIPAQLVFWNYCHQDDLVEYPLRESNSNGGAGAFTLEEVLLKGIYELIERDAFFIFWQNRISPPRIYLDNCQDEKLQTVLGKCRSMNLKVHVCDITSDFDLPTFAAVVQGDDSHIGVGVGTAAGTDTYHVITRALEEALAVRHWMKSEYIELKRIRKQEKRQYVTKMERASFWSSKEAETDIEFFLKGDLRNINESVGWDGLSTKMQLQKTQKILAAKGHAFNGYYYEASSKILNTLGYKVVKVVIPGLIPLVINSTNPPDSMRRKEIAKMLGYHSSAIINPLPHPLF